MTVTGRDMLMVDKYTDAHSKLPYHEEAYIDPLQFGFGLANTGSIIPVNALPGNI